MARVGKPKWYPRKNWSALADSTRKRYTRHGITSKNWYTKAGQAKVTVARGHAATPERPERAQRNPQRYPEYIQRRSSTPVGGPSLEQQARERKRRLFATRIGWSRKNEAQRSYDGTDSTYRMFKDASPDRAESMVSLIGRAKQMEHDIITIDGKDYQLVEWEWLLYH